MTILHSVPESARVEWEIFSTDGNFASGFLLNVGVIPLSQDMIDCIIGFKRWHGTRYTDDSGNLSIGYGKGDPNSTQGMTEAEAYSEWLDHAKKRQRALVTQLPLVEMPQTAFDALVSLYADTGRWRTIKAEEGEYDVRGAVERSDWRMLADMLARGTENGELRKAEARIAQLGKYSKNHDRAALRKMGLQDIRRKYIDGLYRDDFERAQAEHAYYRETKEFLPGLSTARLRRIRNSAIPS